MADFDPDAYLQSKGDAFDPDAYLKAPQPQAPQKSRAYQSEILPLARDEQGSLHFAVPGFLKQIGSAATLPGDVASGKTAVDINDPNFMQRVTTLAGIGSPTEFSLAPRGGRIPVTPPLQSGSDLLAAGKAVYNDPAIKSIPIDPKKVAGLSGQIENDLTGQGFRPTTGSAPGTLGEIKSMTPQAQAPDRWASLEAEMNGLPPPSAPQIKDMSVDDLRAVRRALNMTAKQKDIQGKPTPDANAATQAIGHVDTFLDSVAPELRTANANYSAGKAAQNLDFRAQMADRRAAKTGSGSNIENTMRQEADKIPNRGLRPDEIAAKDQIVMGTAARNALRKVGKVGFGDGLSLMYHLAAAVPTMGLSVPVAVAATAARKVGESLTRRELDAMSKMIRSRSPAAQARVPQLALPSQPKQVAAMLLGRNGVPSMYRGVVPSYAEENK